MATSRDGYVARGPADDMSWLGPYDKAVFRILTAVDGKLVVSEKSSRFMPARLVGRSLTTVSRSSVSLASLWVSPVYQRAWLLGGQTLALHAKAESMIDEVHLCVSDRLLPPGNAAIKFDDSLLDGMVQVMKTHIGDTTIELWRTIKEPVMVAK